MTFVTSFRYFLFPKNVDLWTTSKPKNADLRNRTNLKETKKSIEILFLYLLLFPTSVERINDKVKVGVITTYRVDPLSFIKLCLRIWFLIQSLIATATTSLEIKQRKWMTKYTIRKSFQCDVQSPISLWVYYDSCTTYDANFNTVCICRCKAGDVTRFAHHYLFAATTQQK